MRRGALRARRFSASACRSWKAPRTAEQAGPALADIAESVIAGLLPQVEARTGGQRRAACRARGFAVVAMGKLGGREMTASSDLDLVFVYDVPAGVEASDGAQAAVAARCISRGWRSG